MDSSADEHIEPQRSRWRASPWLLTVLATAVFVIGTIGPPLFGRGVFLSSDLIYKAYPWRALDDPSALNVNHHGPTSDNVDVTFPARSLFSDALWEGTFAGWDPWVSGGKPLGSIGAGSVLSPFGLAYLLGPDWYAPALDKLLTLAASIGFTYLFCRRLRVDRTPALLAGIAFAGSGYMVMWTNWSHVDVAACIPALFWATERYLQTRTAAAAVPIALATAAMLLGAFPAVAGYALYVLGAYVVARLAADRRRNRIREAIRSLVGSVGGIGIGFMLASAVLVPFALRLSAYDLGYRGQTPDSNLGVHTLMTTVAPGAFGLSSSGQAYPGPGQVESIAFVGVTIAVLALLSLALPLACRVPHGARGALAGATVVIGAATFVGGPLLGLLQELPVFSNSFIGRTRSILGFTIPVLAALGLQAVLERRGAPLTSAQRRTLWAVLGLGATLATLVTWEAVQFVRPLGRGDVLGRSLVLPAVIGVATLVTLGFLWLWRDRPLGIAALALLPILLVVESLSLSLPLLPNESRDTLYPMTDATQFLKDNVGQDRVAVEHNTFYGNSPSLYGFRTVTGHAFTAKTWKEMLNQVDPNAFSGSATLSKLGDGIEIAVSPALDRMGVTWFAATPDAPPFGTTEQHSLDDGTCSGNSTLETANGVTVPAAGGVRGVIVRICQDVEVPKDATLLARASNGSSAAEGWRPLAPVVTRGQDLVVPVPGDLLAGDGELAIDLGLENGGDTVLPLARTPDGSIAFDVIRPEDDGLRMAFAGELLIYERLAGLPRVRWAPSSETIENDEERLARLAGPDLDPEVVVLEDEVAPGDGRGAEVDLTDDGLTRQEVTVSADGDGFVVFADAFQRDWQATVDGQPVELLPADHAGVAVRVPEGEHTIAVTYVPRGGALGLVISGVGLVIVAVIVVVSRRSRRRRRSDPADTGGSDSGDDDSDAHERSRREANLERIPT